MIEVHKETEAEETLLSCLIRDHKRAWGLRGYLEKEHFTSTKARALFGIIKSMSDNEEPVDAITLASKVKGNEVLGVMDIMEYDDKWYSSENFTYYRDTVVNAHNKRMMYETMYDIINDDKVLEQDELIQKMLKSIEKVQSTGHDGFSKLSDAGDEAMDMVLWRFEHPNESLGESTGFLDLDRMLGGFQDGRVYLLGARPSHGKTALAMQMCTALSNRGIKTGVISTEMTKTQLYLRQLFSEARVDSSLMNYGEMTDEDLKKLANAKGKVDSAPIFVNEVGMSTASAILAQARVLVAQEDIKFLMVDYIQLLNEGGDNRNLELGKISRMLKLFAQAMGIPVLILSQLGRDAEGVMPKLTHLRDSGTLEQDADAVMFLFRPEKSGLEAWKGEDTTGLALVEVSKNRDGQCGSGRLTFIPQFVRFENYISPDTFLGLD